LGLFHAPGFVLPLFNSLPGVVTVHDLAYLLYPAHFPTKRRHYFQWLVPPSLRRARRIITVSENSKRDLCRLLAVPEEKVRVIYNGVEPQFRVATQPALVERVRAKYELPPKIVLSVGVLEPRKNLERLVQAFALLRQRGIEHRLVLVGAAGWGYENLLRLPRELGLDDAVRFLGFVSQADLPLLYNAADLFVYPSLYEGFGLPALEAMACGTPVVVSHVSSLPEVVGDAGVLVDPHSVEGIAEAIYRCLRSDGLREELREAGLKQAARFSWHEAARQTLQVYREVLAIPDRKAATQELVAGERRQCE
jgi:glycosyltransferase involved in cell wall biosynthesis